MWKIAEFGELIGVSSSTLRRWEQEEKLIPERTLGNQRIYTEKHSLHSAKSKDWQVANSCHCVLSSFIHWAQR